MGKKLKCLLFCFYYLMIGLNLLAQFPPPVGQLGTTAIYKDSSAIIGWAKSGEVVRGFVNISDTNFTAMGSNRASYGIELWISDSSDIYAISLGDGGIATLSFHVPIINGIGNDFVVFENAFSDTFLELAFVEVSSDGNRFVRFPSVSLTQTDVQVGTFGLVDATKIHNLAGKYRFDYGTPFDLDDIKDSVDIDLNNINYVRIIDVIGSIQDTYSTFDSQQHKINDPWPTPFNTGGFDLNAVGVIHNTTENLTEHEKRQVVDIFPNPVTNMITLISLKNVSFRCTLCDVTGRVILIKNVNKKCSINMTGFPQGIYFACLSFPDGSSYIKRICKN